MDIIFKREEWVAMKIKGRKVSDNLTGVKNNETRFEIMKGWELKV